MTRSKRTKQKKETGRIKKSFYLTITFQVSFLSLLVFILYGNTLFNGYSLDDSLVVQNNKVVERGFKAIPEIFSTRYIETDLDSKISTGYRPIVTSTFALEYELFGYAPGISHFLNVVLYALACIMLFLILKRIFNDYHFLFPLVITTLFIAHPMHTEVVASLKNRDEIIVLLSALLSMFLFLKYADRNKIKFLFAGAFFFLFAVFSKPTALPYLALIPLVLYFFTNLKFSKILLVTLSLIAVYLVVRYVPQLYLPKGFRPRLFYENNIRFEDLLTRITTGLYILLFYLKKLAIPFPLLYYYGYNTIPVVGIGNIWVIISLLFHLVILGFAIYKIKEKHIFSFIILFYLISIAPFTNVVRPIMGIVAERFLLTPTIAFSIFLGLALFLIFKINPAQKKPVYPNMYKIVVVVVIILIPYSAITVNRNTQWENHLTLYENDIQYLENSVKANELYATRLLMELESGNIPQTEREETIKKIITHYSQALKLYPEYDKIWNNLAILYSKLNKPKESIQYHKKAIELKPENNLYRLNLGARYHQIKNYNEAIKCWKTCLENDSTYNEARLFLSIVYVEKEQYDLAKKINKEIIRFDSLSDKPYENLGFIYLQTGDTTLAIQNWETAVLKNQHNENVCNMLHRYFSETNNPSKAAYYRNLALKSKENKKVR
ncbi:MAG: tetratricopeptide repeat protein [Bacteroidales bacterium]